jgi:NAD(P)-dependent dehydrogenase (short-subunit alcohol dehydrogenase family)
MLAQGHGAIVNIGSTVIVRGGAQAPQYAAAKYGLVGVTKSYAHAFAPAVRVKFPAKNAPPPRIAGTRYTDLTHELQRNLEAYGRLRGASDRLCK